MCRRKGELSHVENEEYETQMSQKRYLQKGLTCIENVQTQTAQEAH